MPNRALSTIGIVMPEDFAVEAYEAIYCRVVKKIGTQSNSYDEFASAWNAVAYRFLSCTEYNKTFTESIQKSGNAPPHQERYVQERALFGFFLNGLATIESLCYGLFAIGSILLVQYFPFTIPEDKRRVSPEETTLRFKAAFPKDDITAILRDMTNSKGYRDWKNVRNVLTHRSAPGRHIYKGGDRDGEVDWVHGNQIDENTTVTRRKWLAKTSSDLLEATDVFTAVRL